MIKDYFTTRCEYINKNSREKLKSNSLNINNRNKNNSIDPKYSSIRSTAINTSIKFPLMILHKPNKDFNKQLSLKKLTKHVYSKERNYIKRHISMSKREENDEANDLNEIAKPSRKLVYINDKPDFIKTHLTIRPSRLMKNPTQIKILRGVVNLNDLAQGMKAQYATKPIEKNGVIFYKYDLSQDAEENDRYYNSNRKPQKNSKVIMDLINAYRVKKDFDMSFLSKHLNRKFNEIQINRAYVFEQLKGILDKRKNRIYK